VLIVEDVAGYSAGRILVVEDDDSLRELLQAGLGFAGFDVVTVRTGTDGLAAAAAGGVDLVVLDVNLGDLDGFAVCRQLRAAGDDVPVIFLTARRDAEDLRSGFEGGADDYLTKPFSLDELTFRIGAVLRRAAGRSGRAGGRLACGAVELDETSHQVWCAGQETALTPTEFRLLHYLLANTGIVLTRAQILDHVWPHDYDGDWQIIETYVSSLRRKLEHEHSPRIVHTVRGIGYSARRPA